LQNRGAGYEEEAVKAARALALLHQTNFSIRSSIASRTRSFSGATSKKLSARVLESAVSIATGF
jgi:hypothetical protein